MRFYTQDNLWLEQVGIDVWRIGLTKTATRPNGVTSSWNYEDKRNLLTQVQNGSVSDFSYTNNAIGNRTAMSRAGSAFKWLNGAILYISMTGNLLHINYSLRVFCLTNWITDDILFLPGVVVK